MRADKGLQVGMLLNWRLGLVIGRHPETYWVRLVHMAVPKVILSS